MDRIFEFMPPRDRLYDRMDVVNQDMAIFPTLASTDYGGHWEAEEARLRKGHDAAMKMVYPRKAE